MAHTGEGGWWGRVFWRVVDMNGTWVGRVKGKMGLIRE